MKRKDELPQSTFSEKFVMGTVTGGGRRSNLVEPAELPEIGLLTRGLGAVLLCFSYKKQQDTEFAKALES